MESGITSGGASVYLTQIFDISTKIRAYNVRDFDPNFRHFDKIRTYNVQDFDPNF